MLTILLTRLPAHLGGLWPANVGRVFFDRVLFRWNGRGEVLFRHWSATQTLNPVSRLLYLPLFLCCWTHAWSDTVHHMLIRWLSYCLYIVFKSIFNNHFLPYNYCTTVKRAARPLVKVYYIYLRIQSLIKFCIPRRIALSCNLLAPACACVQAA